jgi:hypothetical protein
MALLDEFHKGNVDIYILKFAILSLIPKEEDATSMNFFKPISLLNCSLKIFRF